MDNAVNYKVVKVMLMEKGSTKKLRRIIPCEVHCIDLTLEDIQKKKPIF
jgi:hypothetical protein